MILDTSALLAILLNEPERNSFLHVLENTDSIKISAATLLESSIVMDARYGIEGIERLREFLSIVGVDEIPCTAEQRQYAETAFAKFGKGRRNRAKLNFGDLFAYSLAKTNDEPLLFKGDDFIHTDIKQVT